VLAEDWRSDGVVKIGAGHNVPVFFEALVGTCEAQRKPYPRNSAFHSSVAFCCLALPASAQDFVLYPFSTNLNRTVVGPGVTPALGGVTLSGAFIGDDGFGNVLEAYPAVGSTSAALALANSSFFTLSLSITPGNFGPVGVNFSVGKGGNSDPRGYFVRTSLDGFASNVLSQTLPGGANQAPAPQSFSLDLTGQSSITLRFYVWTPNPANNSIDFRIWKSPAT
jgi:hypothetical protein